MSRYVDTDELVNELHEHFSKGFDGDEWWNSTHVLTAIKQTPTVDAIPVAFIESEKQRVQGMIEESVKMGMIAESERLSLVMVILDHVVSNWYYNTGPEWRGEPNDTNRF